MGCRRGRPTTGQGGFRRNVATFRTGIDALPLRRSKAEPAAYDARPTPGGGVSNFNTLQRVRDEVVDGPVLVHEARDVRALSSTFLQ